MIDDLRHFRTRVHDRRHPWRRKADMFWFVVGWLVLLAIALLALHLEPQVDEGTPTRTGVVRTCS